MPSCTIWFQLDLVHRDVRQENFTCDAQKRNYFWLDLELCGPAGAPSFSLNTWTQLDSSPLVNGEYSTASDIYCFGSMFKQWAVLVYTEQGHSFLQLLATPSSLQILTAEQLL